MDCVSLYNNADLISKVSEEIASKNTDQLLTAEREDEA